MSAFIEEMGTRSGKGDGLHSRRLSMHSGEPGSGWEDGEMEPKINPRVRWSFISHLGSFSVYCMKELS